MLYGLYPEVYLESDPGQKQILLDKILESYLYKDILTFQRVKNSQAIKNLSKALAYQIGSEVNENELSNRLKIDRKTVVNYLDVLEKASDLNSQAIKNLSKALAYQIGSEVNENELSNRLKIDRKTVVNYLDVLEKA